MNFTRAHDQYLNTPDELEAVLCDDCGEEMEQRWTAHAPLQHVKEWKCTNQYCPAKFDGVAAEMAELLIGANETVKSLAAKVKRAEKQYANLVEAVKNSGLE
jgi:threonine synthase